MKTRIEPRLTDEALSTDPKKARYRGLWQNGAPGTIRTCDPLVRSQVLYPAELRVRKPCPARPDGGRVL